MVCDDLLSLSHEVHAKIFKGKGTEEEINQMLLARCSLYYSIIY
jgi:hypothetical protein